MADDKIIGTVEIEERSDGKFYYVLDENEPVGPYDDTEQATQAAIEFLQAAMTRLVKQSLGV